MKLISFIHTYTHVHAHSHAHIRYRLINGVARNGYFIINYLFKWRCHCDRNDGTLLLLLLLLRSFYMARAASMLSCGFKNRIVSSKINRFNSSRGKSSNSISRRNGLSATGWKKKQKFKNRDFSKQIENLQFWSIFFIESHLIAGIIILFQIWMC